MTLDRRPSEEASSKARRFPRGARRGSVLDQAPEAQARRAIDLMLNRIGLLDVAVDTAPIRFVTVTAESL